MDTSVKISIIIAVAQNGVIGRGDELPWHLSDDLKRFKELTLNHTVIVGRKTHESIIKRLGHPLPDRHTIVITRQDDYKAEGCEAVHSPEEALKMVPAGEEVFVIGGAEIYKAFLPLAGKIYRTSILANVDGDVFLPSECRLWEWQIVVHIYHPKDERHEYYFYWDVFLRKPSKKEAKTFVVLENARYEDQRRVMLKIDEGGFCPFCPEHRSKAELEPVIKEGRYWELRKNRWPYENTRLHLLAIYKRHAEKLKDLEPEALGDLLELLKWAEIEYRVESGAVGIRFGEPNRNGGTVKHLHAQFMVADITDKSDPRYKPVRLRVG